MLGSGGSAFADPENQSAPCKRYRPEGAAALAWYAKHHLVGEVDGLIITFA